MCSSDLTCDEGHERVVAVGGLHIIGTERHDSRRIDNQLRGRAGRQGDPGSSRFYLSLEDDLMKRFASDRIAGIMERFGLEEDMAIESRLVSKTIESAQTRVEGYNFDIRKRVVEFDDVINKQRETIYEERDKVIRNEDLTDTIQAFVDEEIDAIVDTHLASALPMEEWNMAALVAAVDALGLGGPDTTEDALWGHHNRDAIAMLLKDLAAERLEQKDAESSVDWALIERLVLLRTIDSVWIEHLTEIDELRQGIGLRGFAQEDPLNAFKKEAHGLYQEMRQLIRHQVATTIFRVSIIRQPAQPPADGTEVTGEAGSGGEGSPDGASMAGGVPKFAGPPLPRALPQGQPFGGATNTAAAGGKNSKGGEVRPGYSPAGVRMGRNDTCWCGSGQKYKKCHGS